MEATFHNLGFCLCNTVIKKILIGINLKQEKYKLEAIPNTVYNTHYIVMHIAHNAFCV